MTTLKLSFGPEDKKPLTVELESDDANMIDTIVDGVRYASKAAIEQMLLNEDEVPQTVVDLECNGRPAFHTKRLPAAATELVRSTLGRSVAMANDGAAVEAVKKFCEAQKAAAKPAPTRSTQKADKKE